MELRDTLGDEYPDSLLHDFAAAARWREFEPGVRSADIVATSSGALIAVRLDAIRTLADAGDHFGRLLMGLGACKLLLVGLP